MEPSDEKRVYLLTVGMQSDQRIVAVYDDEALAEQARKVLAPVFRDASADESWPVNPPISEIEALAAKERSFRRLHGYQ